MTNAELIYNLRYCFEKRKTVVGVPWYVWCDRAADALEAAEKRIAELEEERNKTVTEIFWEEQSWWENRCKELEAQNAELVTKCIQLEAQIPKRGEWKPIQIGKWHGYECPNCKIAREVPCGNNGIPQWNYCPNCGARMNHKYCDVVNGCVMCDIELCNGKEKQNDTKRA